MVLLLARLGSGQDGNPCSGMVGVTGQTSILLMFIYISTVPTLDTFATMVFLRAASCLLY